MRIHLGLRVESAQDHAGVGVGQRHSVQRYQVDLFTVCGEHDPFVEDLQEGVLMDLGRADRIQRRTPIQPQKLMQTFSQAHPVELQGLEKRCSLTQEIRTLAHRQAAKKSKPKG